MRTVELITALFSEVDEQAFHPEVCARLRVDELGRHAHLVLGTAHTAFQQVADAQLPAKLLHVHRLAAVGLYGVARDHRGACTGHHIGPPIGRRVQSPDRLAVVTGCVPPGCRPRRRAGVARRVARQRPGCGGTPAPAPFTIR
jgi:hypothetical protein